MLQIKSEGPYPNTPARSDTLGLIKIWVELLTLSRLWNEYLPLLILGVLVIIDWLYHLALSLLHYVASCYLFVLSVENVTPIHCDKFRGGKKFGKCALSQFRELLNSPEEVGFLVDELSKNPLLDPKVLNAWKTCHPSVLCGHDFIWPLVLFFAFN
jgi:hypothetical protein